MRIIQNITEDERKKILEDLYKSFVTGFDFEEFLKPLLEVLGLKEVSVTKKTGDGGVDLLGILPGLSELDNSDSVQYKIQAKRNDPSSIISPEKIDALRGNLNFNQKGLFITTARVSEKAKEEALTKDLSKPVIVIDGTDLVNICIQKQICCAYKPIFSKDAYNEFLGKRENKNIVKANTLKNINLNGVRKTISSNDIRARIISIPSSIVSKIPNNMNKHNLLLIIDETKYNVTFNPTRNYLGSVTSMLKKYKLLKDDGTYEEKNAVWAINSSGDTIYLTILEN